MYLGPKYSDKIIKQLIKNKKLSFFEIHDDENSQNL